MTQFKITLIVANLVTFMWLIFGAQRELPPWQDSFKNAKEAVDQIVPATKSQEIMIYVIKARLNVAEDFSKSNIEEYSRLELPLTALAIFNLAGLIILVLPRKSEPGVAPNRPLPPPLKSLSSIRDSENS